MQDNIRKNLRLEQHRFYSLDFLKFLLTTIIVFHHFQQVMEIKFARFNFFFGRIYFGYVVEFFFIISGFVVAFQIQRKAMGSFRSWMLKRMSRILPMAALSIVAILAVEFVKMLLGKGTMPGLWNIVTSLTCTFVGGGVQLSSLGVNNPLWYVSVLFICYAVLYTLTRLSKRIGIGTHYLYIAMVMLGLGIHYWGINLPFMNGQVSRGYVCFFLGMLLYELYETHASRKIFVVSAIVSVLILLCILTNHFIDDMWAILTFLLFPAALFSFLGAEKLFAPKIFSILGGIAFEMYLWHVPFLLFYKSARPFIGIQAEITQAEMVLFAVVLIVFCIPMTLFVEKTVGKAVARRLPV